MSQCNWQPAAADPVYRSCFASRSRANAFCHNQLQICLAAASQQLEKPLAQRWHRELDHTNSAPLRFPQLLTFFWLVELSATLPEKTQGFAPESVLSPVNSHTAELLHFPTTWWWVVGMMMWLTWWCGWHDDVVDMMVGMPTMTKVIDSDFSS